MLLLTDQRSRIGVPQDFKLFDSKIVVKIEKEYDNYQIHLDISDDGRPFFCSMPAGYSDLVKRIGGWLGYNVRRQEGIKIKPSIGHNNRKKEYTYDIDRLNAVWLSQNVDIKKLKSKIWLRTNQIAKCLASWILDDYKKNLNLDRKTWDEMNFVAWRAGIRLAHGKDCYLAKLICLYKNCDKETFKFLLNDTKTYHRSFLKWILERYDPTKGKYQDFLRESPAYIKLCRHSLNFVGFEVDYLNNSFKRYGTPQNRWQWYILGNLLHDGRYDSLEDIHNQFNNSEMLERKRNFRFDILKSLLNTDISIWHYFKKAMRIKKPYSHSTIRSMVDTINDGILIYKNNKVNKHNIHFAEVNGSIMNMLRNAIYNHNQDRELAKLKRFEAPNNQLPEPPVNLPEWIENIRMKTAHDLIRAGIECQHCIGNYTSSNDIFVREKDICAQIERQNLRVRQCYDVRDQITKESKSLEKRLEKELSKIRASLKIESRPEKQLAYNLF